MLTLGWGYLAAASQGGCGQLPASACCHALWVAPARSAGQRLSRPLPKVRWNKGTLSQLGHFWDKFPSSSPKNKKNSCAPLARRPSCGRRRRRRRAWRSLRSSTWSCMSTRWPRRAMPRLAGAAQGGGPGVPPARRRCSGAGATAQKRAGAACTARGRRCQNSGGSVLPALCGANPGRVAWYSLGWQCPGLSTA